jgi:hypothetical protein
MAELVESEAYREWVVRKHIGYVGDALQDWLRAETKVAAQLDTHDIVSLRISEPSPTALIEQIGCLFRLGRSVQTVYFSCHGTIELLSYDRPLTTSLTFEEFGLALSALLQDCVTLVLGCCHGLDEHSTLLSHIPDQVSEIYGFTREPKSFDVASLMLGVLLDQARCYQEMSNANTTTFGGGISESELDAAASRFGADIDHILDHFIETPDKYVREADGFGIRWLKRVNYGERSVWQGRTIPLRDR